MRNPELRGQARRLRAFARSRWSQKYQPYHEYVGYRLTSASSDPTAFHEAVIVPHDELAFDLLHRVHGHTDDDEKRRAAEKEGHVEALGDPGR